MVIRLSSNYQNEYNMKKLILNELLRCPILNMKMKYSIKSELNDNKV